MDKQTRDELWKELIPHTAGGFQSPPEHSASDFVDASTDELLAWLPIPDGAWWELLVDQQGAGCFEGKFIGVVDLWVDFDTVYTFQSQFLPEAILRCWLAYKTQETA